ncbi:hypothetical protein HAX54_027529 [Datura stramonium]|uniref:Uncharacterized protein n=1 Tax=Datura stramonium TaxID=4076 RepID=A0ABS8V5D6_DATST|nr:hypothetical protein [Datura stramonium]
MKSKVVVEDAFVYSEETNLTVRKTSLFFTGDGFTAYDCKGQLVFRVGYVRSRLVTWVNPVLMDAAKMSSHCPPYVNSDFLQFLKQRPSLHNSGRLFRGKRRGAKANIQRSDPHTGRSNVTVEVYSNPAEEYQIEGSFAQRNAVIFFDADKVSVAGNPTESGCLC